MLVDRLFALRVMTDNLSPRQRAQREEFACGHAPPADRAIVRMNGG
jgi:hypothetical protein